MDSTQMFANLDLADESGVTAIEYGLLAGLIAIGIIGGLSATSDSMIAMYTFWAEAVSKALTL